MEESIKKKPCEGPATETNYCCVEAFLSKNEKLIADFANRILRTTPQDKEDLKLEAAVAYYEALNYINFFKKTKFSSVFTWFYKKRLYAKRKFDLTCTLQGAGRNKLPPPGKTIDEITIENASSEWDSPAFASHAPAKNPRCGMSSSGYPLSPQDHQFNLCLESFTGKVSMRVYRALILLLGDSDIKFKKKTLKSLFNCQSLSNIEEVVRSRIKQEIKDAGLCLYLAVYSGSSIHRVIVCADSEENAKGYLSRDGDLSELRRLW